MPSASSATPTLASVILSAISTSLRNTAVALPGTVLSYDAESRTCTVQPGVHRLVPSVDDEDEDEVEELPAVQRVPVCWLVGRGIQVKASLSKGDSVLLIALDRDPSGWQRAGSPQPPDDVRMHHWANAVAIPGLVPDQSPFPEPRDAAALASKVDALYNLLASCTPSTVESGLTAIKTQLSGEGWGPGSPRTTGSAILKLDE